MISVNIHAEISQALQKMDRQRTGMLSKTPAAINKIADQARLQSAAEIQSAGYNLSTGRILSEISVEKASVTRPVATLRASGKPIPLIEFDARQTPEGVTVAVKNGRKLIPGAFIATMPSGRPGVFERIGTGHKKIVRRDGSVQWHGLPIREKTGPSIPTAFANPAVQAALTAMVEKNLKKIIKE